MHCLLSLNLYTTQTPPWLGGIVPLAMTPYAGQICPCHRQRLDTAPSIVQLCTLMYVETQRPGSGQLCLPCGRMFRVCILVFLVKFVIASLHFMHYLILHDTCAMTPPLNDFHFCAAPVLRGRSRKARLWAGSHKLKIYSSRCQCLFVRLND